MGTAAQSPGVSSASSAATRGRMTIWMERFAPMEMIFVVENSLQTPNFTSQSASLEEVASWVLRPSERTLREPKSSRDHVIESSTFERELNDAVGLSPGIQAVVVLKDERSAGPLFCDVRIYLTRRYSQREPLRSRHGKASHTGSVPGPSAHHHSLTVLL